MNKIQTLIVTAFCLAAGPVFAGAVGSPVTDPVVVPVVDPASSEPETSVRDWSGYYAGLHLGFGSGSYNTRGETPVGLGPDISVDGLVGGATIGRNWQNGRTIYGIEADISTGPSGSVPRFTPAPVWNCGQGDCNVKIDYFATLRGRYGWVSGRGFFYGTAGLAAGRATGGIANSPHQGSGTAFGWTAGAGYEYALNDRNTLKIEALYVDLGKLPFGTDNRPTPEQGTFFATGDFAVIRVGWNIRF